MEQINRIVMDKVNMLFDELLKTHNLQGWEIYFDINKRMTNAVLGIESVNWNILFEDAKAEIWHNYLSNEIDNTTFLKVLRDKTEKIKEAISLKNYNVRDTIGDKSIFLFSEFNVWLNDNFVFEDSLPLEKIDAQEKFNPEIFKDQESYNLFLFLADGYAHKKSVTQFSQIYHWLVSKDNKIKTNKGTKYRELVKERFKLEGAFSRIADEIYNEQVTITDISKDFNA